LLAGIALAGTGHLVLATLHANNCAESLDRIINMFPREQHNQIFCDRSRKIWLCCSRGNMLMMRSSDSAQLLLATLHANNCAESLDRIINMFPREQHNQIFLDLSQYLRGVMAQRLVMGKEGRRVAAVEIMLNTPYIATLIKKGDVVSIKEAIHKSAERGIQSFDEALYTLFKSGKVELEEALTYADSRANLEAKVNFG